jgi:hypothetical protein
MRLPASGHRIARRNVVAFDRYLVSTKRSVAQQLDGLGAALEPGAHFNDKPNQPRAVHTIAGHYGLHDGIVDQLLKAGLFVIAITRLTGTRCGAAASRCHY